MDLYICILFLFFITFAVVMLYKIDHITMPFSLPVKKVVFFCVLLKVIEM